MPRALSQRASQKPSRPASKATAMREILCSDLTASSRQRLSNVRRALSSVFNFLSGWRSTPGTIPATNQLDRLNSTTAINVVSMSRAIRDRLKSFGLRCRGIGGLRRSVYIRADGYNPRRSPHRIYTTPDLDGSAVTIDILLPLPEWAVHQ